MTPIASVVAIQVRGADLQPGDLFSYSGPTYWETALNSDFTSQHISIRTNTPLPPEKRNTPVYKLTVLVKDP